VSAITRRVISGVLVLVSVLAGCAPTEPPPGANATPTPSGVSSANPVVGTPVVTTSGGTVEIVGTGQTNTPDFELPAGTVHVTISTCASNGVIPFVTLFEKNGAMVGLIVDAAYDVKNLAGGTYHLGVVANPECTWTINLTPA
jgi:hypothetical protein